MAVASLEASTPLIALHTPVQRSRSDPSSSSSILFAFKVAQIVQDFRKRVKNRIHGTHLSRRSSIQLQEELCQDYQEQASTEIDDYLEQRHVYDTARTRSKTSLAECVEVKDHKTEHDGGRCWQTSFSACVHWTLPAIPSADGL